MPLISWTPLNLTPAATQALTRSSHALITHAGRAYIFGGELKPRTPVDGVLHTLDLSSGLHNSIQAATAEEGPTPRVGTGLAKVGDALYLWGGRGGKEMKPLRSELWKYDLASKEGKWEKLLTKGDQPEERSYHVLTGVQAQNALYLHAGCPASGRLSTLHVLDLSTLTFRSLTPAPEPGRGGTVLAAVQSIGTKGSLIRFGGFAGHELGGPLDVYDIAQNKWESVIPSGESPSARSVHALLGIPNLKKGSDLVAVMFGGERDPAPAELGHDGAGRFLSDVWGLKRSADGTWSWEKATHKEEGNVPQPRGWFASDITENGQVIVQGGLNEHNERIGDAWVLNVEEA
ncbi:galactose oxidase [Phlegmacium glaucopus]|nr:galactose oxidase [Phlegmacium glaucopus]